MQKLFFWFKTLIFFNGYFYKRREISKKGIILFPLFSFNSLIIAWVSRLKIYNFVRKNSQKTLSSWIGTLKALVTDYLTSLHYWNNLWYGIFSSTTDDKFLILSRTISQNNNLLHILRQHVQQKYTRRFIFRK